MIKTAAHNVYDKDQRNVTPANELLIWLGKFQLEKEEEGSMAINASDIIVHPDWKPESNNLDADIAMILLDIVADLTAKIQTISLPQLKDHDQDNDEDGFVVKQSFFNWF